MKTIFDIYVNTSSSSSSQQHNFEIITPYGSNHLQWVLDVRQELRQNKQQKSFGVFAKVINFITPKFDIKFTLGLTDKNQPGIQIACATFSVECFINKESMEPGPNEILFAIVDTAKSEVSTILKHRKTNVKIGDQLKCQLPISTSLLTNYVVIRCTVKLTEYGAESNRSSSIANMLLNDAIKSSEPADQYADVTLITADDRKFYAHSCFLAKQSSVFSAMLNDEKFKEGKERQVETPDINSATMQEILRYIYTDCVNKDALESMAPEILYAAEKYHLPEPLKLQCCQVMIGSVDVSNALEFLVIADMFSLEELKLCAIKVVVSNLNQVRQQDKWKEILSKQPNLVDEIFAFTASQLNVT